MTAQIPFVRSRIGAAPTGRQEHMTEYNLPSDTAADSAAPAAAPAPRRRFTVQRGGCGCEGKPSPTAQQKPAENG